MNFELKSFLKRLYNKALEEEITSRAAQVAFYFVFAIFPLLLFIISLFGLILKSGDNLQQELFGYLRQVMPVSAFDLVTQTLNEVVQKSSGGTLTIGFIIALWSASAGMDSIIDALNNVYNFEETRSWWKRKLAAVLLTLVVSLLVFFALAVVIYGSGIVSLFLSSIGSPIPSQFVLSVLSYIFLGIVLLLILTLIYTFGPAHPEFEWNWINAGSIAALVLWIIVSLGFRLYLHFFNSYAKTYGSLGAIIILMLWLYLTALVILIGGAINALLEESPEAESEEKDAAKDEQMQSDANDVAGNAETETDKNEPDNKIAS